MPDLTISTPVDNFVSCADAAAMRTVLGLGTAATATLSTLLNDFTYTAATRILSSTSTGASVTLPNADGTNSGLMTSANFTKLSGIATGATANSSDATLLARANHTGTQASSTILFASTKRLTGRNTAAGGTGEEVTADQLLDWIGTAAPGDLIYRDSSAYSRLAAPAANSILRYNGSGSVPAWSTQWTLDSAGSLACASGTITGNTPAIAITQTWNNVATTFKTFTITVTDTNSAAGSLPFQILGGAAGSTSLFSVSKAGTIAPVGMSIVRGNVTASNPVTISETWNNAGVTFETFVIDTTITAANAASKKFVIRDAGVDKIWVTNNGSLNAVSTCYLGQVYASEIRLETGNKRFTMGGGDDWQLWWDATGQAGIRNGTNVQSLAIYKTYTAGTPDYERLRIYSTAGANPFVIAAEINGTGAYRDISIQAGGNEKLLIQQSTGASCIFKNLTKLEVWGALDISGTFTVGDGYNFALGSTNGTKIGSAITQKIGFWNATPVVQPTNANQAAVAGTAGATYTATEQTLINALKTLVNQLRSDLVTVGIIKGS